MGTMMDSEIKKATGRVVFNLQSSMSNNMPVEGKLKITTVNSPKGVTTSGLSTSPFKLNKTLYYDKDSTFIPNEKDFK